MEFYLIAEMKQRSMREVKNNKTERMIYNEKTNVL